MGVCWAKPKSQSPLKTSPIPEPVEQQSLDPAASTWERDWDDQAIVPRPELGNAVSTRIGGRWSDEWTMQDVLLWAVFLMSPRDVRILRQVFTQHRIDGPRLLELVNIERFRAVARGEIRRVAAMRVVQMVDEERQFAQVRAHNRAMLRLLTAELFAPLGGHLFATAAITSIATFAALPPPTIPKPPLTTTQFYESEIASID